MKAKERLKSLYRLYKNQQKKEFKSMTDGERLDMTLQFFTLKHELSKEIDLLSDPLQSEILYLHYICFMPLTGVSEAVGREYAYTSKLHRKALREYELMLNGERLSYAV